MDKVVFSLEFGDYKLVVEGADNSPLTWLKMSEGDKDTLHLLTSHDLKKLIDGLIARYEVTKEVRGY